MARRRYPRFILREPCQYCERGKKGTYEGDGKLYCSLCGHHLEQYSPIVDDEINPFGLQVADHRASAQDDDDDTLTPLQRREQARRGYSMLFQFLLMQHSLYLVREQKFPGEVEVVVRDLWVLWQSHFPYATFHQPENDAEADPADPSTPLESQRYRAGSRESSVFSSGMSSQGSSDLSDSDLSDRNTETGANRYRARAGTDLGARPNLLDTVSLCYMACRLLRLPVRLGDFHRWIVQGKLSYNSLLATLSREQVRYLDNTHMASVNTAPTLTIRKLFTRSVSFDIAFRRKFGIAVPVLNWPLLAYRYISDMLLPIEVYPMISILCDRLKVDFLLHSDRLNEKRVKMIYLPEVQLIAFIVAATKFLFPADGIRRYISNNGGETVQPAPSFDWKVWLRTIRRRDARVMADKTFGTHDAEKLQDSYVWNKMTPKEMDKYMDWFEENFILKSQDIRRSGNRVGQEIGSEPSELPESGTQGSGGLEVFERLFDTKLQLSPPSSQSRGRPPEQDGADLSDLHQQDIDQVNRTFGSGQVRPDSGVDKGAVSSLPTVTHSSTELHDPVDGESLQQAAVHNSNPNTVPSNDPKEDQTPPLMLGQNYRLFRTVKDLGPDPSYESIDQQLDGEEGHLVEAGDEGPNLQAQSRDHTAHGNHDNAETAAQNGDGSGTRDGDEVGSGNDEFSTTQQGPEQGYGQEPLEMKCYRELYHQASIHSGIPLKYIVGAVYSIDRQLVSKAKAKKSRMNKKNKLGAGNRGQKDESVAEDEFRNWRDGLGILLDEDEDDDADADVDSDAG